MGAVSPPVPVHPFIFSCSFQQDLCLIKLLTFILIKGRRGWRALLVPHNGNQIAKPAGETGGHCPGPDTHGQAARSVHLGAGRAPCARPLPEVPQWGLRAPLPDP